MQRLGFDTRVTVLGHVQRGGTPSAFDRILVGGASLWSWCVCVRERVCFCIWNRPRNPSLFLGEPGAGVVLGCGLSAMVILMMTTGPFKAGVVVAAIGRQSQGSGRAPRWQGPACEGWSSWGGG